MITCRDAIVVLLLLLFVLLSDCLHYDSLFTSGAKVEGLRCIEKEKQALLKLKQDLIDDGDLSSWGGEEDKKECCQWKGIKCNNETGHVIGLQLSGMGGKISNALLEFEYLTHLELTDNDFGHAEIPKFIGFLEKLQYLDLSLSNFSGVVPYHIGNLTNLRILDLGNNELDFKNLHWLSHLSSLFLLDLSNSYLGYPNLLQDILNLPSLQKLYLRNCQLPTYFFVNSSSKSLSLVDLSQTGLTSSSFRWLFNVSMSLRSVDLSYNKLSAIPQAFGRYTFLENLDLSNNHLTGGIPESLGNLSHLQTLCLSGNSLSESLPQLFHKLSGAAKDSIEVLELDGNKFYGSLPDFTSFSSLGILKLQDNQLSGSFPSSFRRLSSVIHLDFSNNRITGSVPDMRAFVSLKDLYLSDNKLEMLPEILGEQSMLETFDVSFNSLKGTVSEAQLSKLKNLKVLDLSFNSLVLNLTSDWIPPFQLHDIRLASCNMGPCFPAWLQTQTKFSKLDLSGAGISDEVPNWFWGLSSRLTYLNLSNNQMTGGIPDLSSSFVLSPTIDISSNNFSGPAPVFHPNSMILQLSNNMFVGSIPSICTITLYALSVLDLSNNQLSGELPSCWENMTTLFVLNLDNNRFSGEIPGTLGSLSYLQTLHLSDNKFSGELPSSLKNCLGLTMIDVAGNELTGNIPAWIGTDLTALRVLSLGNNNFHGSIPPEICYLTEIQILDLSGNSLSGRIPQCFNNFTSLVQNNRTTDGSIFSVLTRIRSYDSLSYIDYALVQWKGQESKYKKILALLKLIDLSSNRLVGNLPPELSDLRALISLNLSRNCLSGDLIANIGQMGMLECLDLSINQFSGKIPTGLAELHFLAVLDLSNNDLSGKIPSGTQLQGFDASVYAGNGQLCGSPLRCCPGDCPNPPKTDPGKQDNADEEDDGFISEGFYISMVLGFILGFWGVVGPLALKNSWRNAYFDFFNRIREWLCVTTIIYAARLRQSRRANVS